MRLSLAATAQGRHAPSHTRDQRHAGFFATGKPAKGGRVVVKAKVQTEFGQGTGRTGFVEAVIRGTRPDAQQIVLTAHLQEEQGSANDDGSDVLPRRHLRERRHFHDSHEQRLPRRQPAGRATAGGSWYYGTVTLEDVTRLLDAAVEAKAVTLKQRDAS